MAVIKEMAIRTLAKGDSHLTQETEASLLIRGKGNHYLSHVLTKGEETGQN